MSDDLTQPVPPQPPLVEDNAPHRVAHGAASMFAGRATNFALQAAYFLLLARLLGGAQEFGLFSGVFALAVTIAPYSAAGSSMLFMRYVSIDATAARVYWGNALALTTFFTTAVCALALLTGVFGHWLAHPFMLAVLLAANCLFSQVTVLASMLLFALDKLRLSAALNTISNAARLLAALALAVAWRHVSAALWSAVLTIASLLAAAVAFAIVQRAVGAPRLDLILLRRRLAEGLGFSLAGGTEAVNNDIDKAMLGHFHLDLQNGFYTLAYRVVDFATAPIGSLGASVTQRQFQLAHRAPPDGLAPVMRLARRSLLISAGLGLLLVVPVAESGRFLPLLAGPSYAGAQHVLYWLCWLPLIRAVHLLAGAAITGLGRQPLRTASQAVAALLSIALNFIWIPRYGWRGAAAATLLCDGLLAVLNVAVLLYLHRILTRRSCA